MRVLFSLSLALSSLWAQDRSDRWREDFDTLERELTTLHPRLREGELREHFVRRIGELRSTVDNSSDQRLAIGIAHLLASLYEAHTNLDLATSSVPLPRLPIAVRWFSDGLFITGASETYARLMDARVVRIGEVSAEDAFTALRPFMSCENEHCARNTSQSYFVLPDLLEAAGVISGTSSVALTIVNRTGEESLVNVVPALVNIVPGPLRTYRPQPHYLLNQYYNYWFDFLPESRTLYIKYNACRELAWMPWAAFLAELREVSAVWPVERLVIDLRHNAGGATKYLLDFLEQHQQDVREGVVSYPKGIYGIIGKRTGSSAVLGAIDLKEAGFTIVGEPTGGKPSSWGVVRSFSLQNSRLTITVSTQFVTRPGHDEMAFEPDLAVDFPSSAWFAGRDAYLDAILNR